MHGGTSLYVPRRGGSCVLSWNVTPKMSSFSFVSIGTEFKNQVGFLGSAD